MNYSPKQDKVKKMPTEGIIQSDSENLDVSDYELPEIADVEG